MFFQKSGVRDSTLNWDLGPALEIPPPILAKFQDGASAISATNCHPSENSYELLPDVSTLVQRCHLSPCTNVEKCGSMVSPVAIRAKNMWWRVEAGAGCSVHRLLVIAHLPAPKRHGVFCCNNQPGKKRKGGQTGQLSCLFYSPVPPTNTSSVCFISLKV